MHSISSNMLRQHIEPWQMAQPAMHACNRSLDVRGPWFRLSPVCDTQATTAGEARKSTRCIGENVQHRYSAVATRRHESELCRSHPHQATPLPVPGVSLWRGAPRRRRGRADRKHPRRQVSRSAPVVDPAAAAVAVVS